MASSLYTYQEKGKTYYSYTEANIGTNAGVSPSTPTNGKKLLEIFILMENMKLNIKIMNFPHKIKRIMTRIKLMVM